VDSFTVLALAIVVALIITPFVVIEVKRRRKQRDSTSDDGDSMRNLLSLAIPVLSPAELRASVQAQRLQRERAELDDEAPES